MTRQRRSHLIILALVPVVVFAAVRCADSSGPLHPQSAAVSAASPAGAAKLARLREATDWIGQYHNDALQYVYAKISKLPLKGRDKHTVCETARRAYGEFHRMRRGTPVPESVDAQLESFCSRVAPRSVRSAVLSAPTSPGRTEISAGAQSLMDQVAFAIDVSTSYEDLSSRVSSIESTAASTLGYEEAQDVFTVGSIALSSATYWANNLTDWVPFTNTADFTVLLATRIVPAGGDVSPAFSNGDDSGSWSAFASQVWKDAKAAAKRAAGGDARAAAKAIMGAALVEAPIIVDVVLGASAAGSIGAVLQL